MTTLKPEKAPSARMLAFDALYNIFEKDAYANITIQNILKNYSVKKEEKHLLTEIIYGVCRKYNYLLWIVGKLSKIPIHKLHPTVRILLLMGLYQLIFLDRIPESAAVNETVKISKKITHIGNSRFINGVLRSYLRQKENFLLPDKTKNRILYGSLAYNEPEWLIRFWEKDSGIERTEHVLGILNEIPLVCIRVNVLKISIEEIKQKFVESGILAEPVPYLKEAFYIHKGMENIFSDFLENGWVYIQSASSMLPSVILNPTQGEKVLDMCAAPGSKTTHMAAMMNNEGHIDAWDLYSHKIELIKGNAKRLGISIIRAGVRDSTVPAPDLNGVYDKVLLDAPCSGLGVLGHKVELRWRRTEESLAEFPPLQKALLRRASEYVRPGGIIVYSTCTLNKMENEHIIQEFLNENNNFEPVEFEVKGIGTSENGMLTLYPDIIKSDGFFISKLRKIKNET